MPEFNVSDRTSVAKLTHPHDRDKQMKFVLDGAIIDAFDLFQITRATGRYDITLRPPMPDIFKRPAKGQADLIWEGYHRWTNQTTEVGTEVARLDTNAAYLSATNVHLPVRVLQHDTSGVFDRKQSGAYLVTPAPWNVPDLPNPLGSDRQEEGPLWVMRPTLEILFDAASDRYGNLCAPPVIHEAWTAPSSDKLLTKWREILRDARAYAIISGDELQLEYVKAMYSKFISTCGDSAFNRELRRQDWAHTFRSKAFANLWRKSVRARTAGLTPHRATGTDELHLVGADAWRAVFSEGRGLADMKLKTLDAKGDRPGDDGVYTVQPRTRRTR